MAEDKFSNIVSSESSEQTIDKAPKQEPPIKAPAPTHGNLPVGVRMTGKEDTGFHRDEQYHEGIDVEKFKDDVNRGSVVLGTGGIDALINERAQNQGFGQQLLNMAGQAIAGEIVGGTLEGLGYLGEIPKAIDYMSGSEREFGNFLTDLGQDIREGSQDLMPIYQRTDSDWHDSGWWASNGVSVASSLSLLLPSMAASKALGMLGKGISKGAGMLHESLDIASKMGKYGKWAAEGISSAVVSRHMENAMEASGVFKEQKEKLLDTFNPKTGKLFTDEEASELAGQGASSTYNANWAMLLQDIPQYLALGKVFNPKTMQLEKAGAALARGAEGGIGKKLLGGASTFLSEGAEESYQYYMSERGKLLSDKNAGLISQEEYNKKLGEKVGDKEMLTSAFWGGLGGSVFSAVGGATNNLFKSKDQKDYEDRYAQANGDFIKERGKAYAAMQQEVMKADASGDPVRRDAAISAMSMTQALDALSHDTLDQHIEMLNNLQNMSPEETQAFAAQTGTEVNIELLKQNIPQAIKQAQELRTSYMKNLNKYDSDTAIAMSRNDYDINQFSKRDKKLQGEMQETRARIPEIGDASAHLRDIIRNKANILSLKKVNEVHTQRIENTSSPLVKKETEKLIKANEATIERMAKTVEHLEANDTRDADQKNIDERVRAGFNNASDDLLPAQTERALLKDAIYLRQQENANLKSASYQKEIKKEKIKSKVKSIINQEGIDKAKKDVTENPDLDEKEKVDLHKQLDERAKDIVIENKAAEAKKNALEQEAKLNAEQKQKVNSVKTTVPTINLSSLGNKLEDEYANEEPDINGSLASKSDALRDKVTEGSPDNAKIYSQPGSPAYQAWMMNGKSKKGTPVKVQAHKEVYAGHQNPEFAQMSINIFNDLLAGKEMTPHQMGIVYDYLPLKTIINGDEKVFSFMSSKLASTEKLDVWTKKDFPTRKAFIDMMIANKKENVDTKVKLQYGGEVMEGKDSSGRVPENKITDFKHLKLKAAEKNNIDGKDVTTEQIIDAIGNNLMFTDENGFLFDMNKEQHPDHLSHQMILPGIPGTNGAAVPLRGAIFLSTTKVDGFKFPLKLNIAKHTKEEAESIANIITEVVNDKSQVKMNSKLKDLPADIQQSLKDYHKAAIDHLTKVKANPTVEEILNAFVYIDPKTKGKTSEMRFSKDNKQLFFGIKGDVLNNNNLAKKQDLINFLIDNKRKQFDIDQWKDNRLYKKYALESGLINTDAEVHGDLFGGRTDVYIEVPGAKAKAKPMQKATTPKGQLSIADRVAASKKVGTKNAKEKGVDGFSGVYVDPTGKHIPIFRPGQSSKPVQDEINRLFDEDIKNAKLSSIVNNSRKTPQQTVEDSMLSNISQQKIAYINSANFRGREALAHMDYMNAMNRAREIAGADPYSESELKEFINFKYEIQKDQDEFSVFLKEFGDFTQREYAESERMIAAFHDMLGDKMPDDLIEKHQRMKEIWEDQFDYFDELSGGKTIVKTISPVVIKPIDVEIAKDSKGAKFRLIVNSNGTVIYKKSGKKLDEKRDAKLIEKALTAAGMGAKPATEAKPVVAHQGNLLSMKSLGAISQEETTELPTINGEDVARKVLRKETTYMKLSVEEQNAYQALTKERADAIREEVRKENVARNAGNLLSMGSVSQKEVNDFGNKVREDESYQEAITEKTNTEISNTPDIAISLTETIKSKEDNTKTINPLSMTNITQDDIVKDVFGETSNAGDTILSLDDIFGNNEDLPNKEC